MSISEEKLEEVRKVLEEADEDGLGELRLWLFKESCRLESRERQIDEMKERLEREREQFNQEKERTMARNYHSRKIMVITALIPSVTLHKDTVHSAQSARGRNFKKQKRRPRVSAGPPKDYYIQYPGTVSWVLCFRTPGSFR